MKRRLPSFTPVVCLHHRQAVQHYVRWRMQLWRICSYVFYVVCGSEGSRREKATCSTGFPNWYFQIKYFLKGILGTCHWYFIKVYVALSSLMARGASCLGRRCVQMGTGPANDVSTWLLSWSSRVTWVCRSSLCLNEMKVNCENTMTYTPSV